MHSNAVNRGNGDDEKHLHDQDDDGAGGVEVGKQKRFKESSFPIPTILHNPGYWYR
jgi:hypothetical protein